MIVDEAWHPKEILRFVKSFPTSACTALVETDAVPGYLKAIGSDEGEHTLACEWLFAEMFGQREERARGKSVQTLVGEKLEQAGLEHKLRTNLVVTVPALEQKIEIPFGYQNGRFNLITPAKFGAADPDRAITQAFKYAVQGRSLFEHPDAELGELQLVVVAKFRPHDRESPTRIAHLFEDFGVKLFTLRQIPDLIEDIRATGKDLQATGRR